MEEFAVMVEAYRWTGESASSYQRSVPSVSPRSLSLSAAMAPGRSEADTGARDPELSPPSSLVPVKTPPLSCSRVHPGGEDPNNLLQSVHPSCAPTAMETSRDEPIATPVHCCLKERDDSLFKPNDVSDSNLRLNCNVPSQSSVNYGLQQRGLMLERAKERFQSALSSSWYRPPAKPKRTSLRRKLGFSRCEDFPHGDLIQKSNGRERRSKDKKKKLAENQLGTAALGSHRSQSDANICEESVNALSPCISDIPRRGMCNTEMIDMKPSRLMDAMGEPAPSLLEGKKHHRDHCAWIIEDCNCFEGQKISRQDVCTSSMPNTIVGTEIEGVENVDHLEEKPSDRKFATDCNEGVLASAKSSKKARKRKRRSCFFSEISKAPKQAKKKRKSCAVVEDVSQHQIISTLNLDRSDGALQEEQSVSTSVEVVFLQKERGTSLKTRKSSYFKSKADALGQREIANKNWVPPVSVHALIQEELYQDPWKVLVACMLLNKTSGTQMRRVIWDLFTLCPTPVVAVKVETHKIEEVIQPLGLQRKRARMIQKFSQDFIGKDWTNVGELHGIGKYATDAYAIFCEGRWRDVKPEDHKLVDYWQYLCATDGLGYAFKDDRVKITNHATQTDAAL